MRLINCSRTKVTQILPYDENFTPLVLSGSWQDLPNGFLINVQDTTSLGIWLHITSALNVEVRVQATYEQDSNDYYNLPIQNVSPVLVGINSQVYQVTETGTIKTVIAAPTADVLHFLKIQIRGTGQVEKAFVTAKGRL